MSNVEITDKITEYCDFAVIHIVWMVKRNAAENGSDRYLVFGMVECYPKELESPLTICEQGNKFSGGRLYYIRITKPIETAVEWYRSIKKNGFITIDWEEYNKNQNSGSIEKRILCGTMQDVKEWPKFMLSNKEKDNKIPFIADVWDVVRTHQIKADDQRLGTSDTLWTPDTGIVWPFTSNDCKVTGQNRTDGRTTLLQKDLHPFFYFCFLPISFFGTVCRSSFPPRVAISACLLYPEPFLLKDFVWTETHLPRL